jgi:ribosomal protein S18 acetylase RimI-like enzyme
LNLKSVFLEVKENNERAIGIYERNGFHEEAMADGMIRMSRSLDEEPAGSAYAGETANSGR